MNNWMNALVPFALFFSVLGMKKRHITPNAQPEHHHPPSTLTNQDSLSVPACQVHFITRSFGSCQHALARLIQRKKKGGGGNEKKKKKKEMLPCLFSPLQISSRKPFHVSLAPAIWNLVMDAVIYIYESRDSLSFPIVRDRYQSGIWEIRNLC